jgi:molybdopterin molybdotransferase
MIPIQEAITLILQQARSFGLEEVNLEASLGRVMGETLYADRPYPPFNRSAMDGYAIIAADLITKNLNCLELIEEVMAGQTAQKKLQSGQCIKIMTGAPVPDEADTVIRVEDTSLDDRKVIFHLQAKDIKRGQNIAKKGEDLQREDPIFEEGQMIESAEMVALAVTGKTRIQVKKRPEIAVISTGDEIVQPGEAVLPHQIRNSNKFAIQAFLDTYHIPITFAALTKDNIPDLQKVLSQALKYDIIIVSGGVSMGDADLVPEVLTSLGVKKVFHKVKIKPGKPLWFGATPSGGAVFALPGNPVSCQFACKLFIEPYLRKCFGLPRLEPMLLPFNGTRKKKSKLDEFFPCQITQAHSMTAITPILFNGSGDIKATLNSNGIAHHPADTETIHNGDLIHFSPWISLS